MKTDGGGWTLVLNYLHKAFTEPGLNVLVWNLPLLSNQGLGVDESHSDFWGHASNFLLSQMDFTEVRFFGISSGHSRTIHFKTRLKTLVYYFKTGAGNCTGLDRNYSLLPGHTAMLPGNADVYSSNYADKAMTDAPFNFSCNSHWNIKAFQNGGYRWEVDDLLCPNCCQGPDLKGNSRNTHHEIWIR